MLLSKSMNVQENIVKRGLAAGLIAISAWGSFPAFAAKGEGPGVSGGGNAINHQMIEAYVSDISLNPVFINQVSPIFAELDKKVPGVGSQLSRRANEVTWYFIPTLLRERTEKQTGLPFDSDQIAVQRYNEVFVDRDQFNALTPDSQVKLIVHESVLAAYLNSPKSEVNADVMRKVRLTVNLIAKSNQMNDQDLTNSLRGLGWYSVKSATEIANEQKKKDDEEKQKEQAEKQKKDEAARLWPVYKPMISSVVNAVKAYCANPALDTLEKSDWSEISTSTRRQIISNFQQLSRIVTPLSAYSGMLDEYSARAAGLTITEVKAHEISSPLKDYLIRDFYTIFHHGRSYIGTSGWQDTVPFDSDFEKISVYRDRFTNNSAGFIFSEALGSMQENCKDLSANLSKLNVDLPGSLN